MESGYEDIDRHVRIAARALARSGLVGPFGHMSARVNAEQFIVCAAKPMGTLGVGEKGVLISINEPLPPGVLGEVRVHQSIYSLRERVGAICRFFPPKTISLSTAGIVPRSRHNLGRYFYPKPTLWDDPTLLRTAEKAMAVAEALAEGRAIVMRGNGAIAVGSTLAECVGHAWLLEESARVEFEVRSMSIKSQEKFLTSEESMVPAGDPHKVFERLWKFLTAGDPEVSV